jgi:hypothetical protein
MKKERWIGKYRFQLEQNTTATAIDHDRQMLKTLFATVFGTGT